VADFKDEFSPETIKSFSALLQVAWPAFPTKQWQTLATDGLGELRMLERVNLLAESLGKCLPETFSEAADVLYRLLESDEFDGWMMLPCGYYVAEAGIDEPDVALPLLAALSPRFSSEGPIRVFIEAHPETTMRYLHQWTTHADEHVRRLVSEGTRPRLPWAPLLRGFIEDPTPAVELLEKLFDDPSEYVRRSVANHLNDLSKDHRELAIELASRWQEQASHGEFVVRHGLRTLIKRGDPDALSIMGFEYDNTVELVSFALDSASITIGESATFTAVLSSTEPTRVAIDYLVHYQGAKGPKAPKVFKLTTRTVEPDSPETVVRKHAFKDVSIRKIHPGPHRIEVQVNGRVLAGADLEVV